LIKFDLSQLLSNAIVSSTYDSAGRIDNRVLGNTLTQDFTYYNWNTQGGRLQNINVGSLQNLNYTYDNNGNISQIQNTISNETQAFGYDNLNRLTSANVTNGLAPYSEAYTYDATTGNLASKAGINYTYDANHKHAVSNLSNGNTYSYDANGNMTTRVVNGQTYTLGYDAENRLTTVTGPNSFSAMFTYDADGKRVKSVINGVTTSFIGNHYEVTGSSITKYYYAGTSRITMRKNGTLTYILTDHLGSTSLVTDANGAVINETKYKAWGETRYSSGNEVTEYQYTGQYSYESDFGLYFYNARFYDPALGRFTSPDTLCPITDKVGNSAACTVNYTSNIELLMLINEMNNEYNGIANTFQSPINTQTLDRYAYGLNNPTKYNDPTGHCVDGTTTAMCIALLSAGPAGWTIITIVTVVVTIPIILYGAYVIGQDIGDAINNEVPNVSLASGNAGGARQVAEHLSMLLGGGPVADFYGHPGMPDPEGRDRKHNAEGLRNSLRSLLKNVEKSGKSVTEYLKSQKWTTRQIDELYKYLDDYIENVLSVDQKFSGVKQELANEIKTLAQNLVNMR
jgi:RHS repeat-associated protein